MEFIKEILTKIKPTKEEVTLVNEIYKNIKSKIKIKDAVVELGGSGAKDTWLSKTNDIDIYVKFNKSKYSKKDISTILEKSLKKHFRISKLHGSRDYFQIKIKKFTVEIIPILKINKVKEAENITDISPFHVKYVKKYNKGDEIRLVKEFCKAQNCYGAESYIQGFSGYVLEILTIKYGSFNNFIKNISKWKKPTLIGNKNLINKLNKSKTKSPLILIDPVDEDRNASAAVNEEKYNQLITSCKNYLKKPSEKFFIKQEFNLEKIKNKYKNKNLIILNIKPLTGKQDVVGSKLLKCLNYIQKRLTLNDFKVYNHNLNWDKKTIFYFVLDKKSLSKYKDHKGPPIKNKEALDNFVKKWKHYKTKKGFAYIKIKRKFTDPKLFLKDLIKKDKNIKRLIKSITFK